MDAGLTIAVFNKNLEMDDVGQDKIMLLKCAMRAMIMWMESK